MFGRIYNEEEHEEIYKRTQEGGIVYLIERTDTNEYAYEEMLGMQRSDNFKLPRILWVNHLNSFGMVGSMFLTKKDAEKINKGGFREGGCHCCGHGSKEIPTIVTEHEYLLLK